MSFLTHLANIKKLSNISKFYKSLHYSQKNVTTVPEIKISRARGTVVLSDKIFTAMKESGFSKGEVFSMAELAGINGTRQTGKLILSLGHHVKVDSVGIKAVVDEASKTVVLTSTVKCPCKHDIDTEAMMALAIAAISIFDMVKKYDHGVFIRDIELVHSSRQQDKGVNKSVKQ